MRKRTTLLALLVVFANPAIVTYCLADAAAQLEQAEQYAKAGNYEQAEAIYQAIVTNSPGTDDAFQARKELTILYVLWGKQPEADQALTNLLADFSGHETIATAVTHVADTHRELEKHKKACGIYQYVVDHWPDEEHGMWSQMGLVISNINLGNDDVAETAFEKLRTKYSGYQHISRAICLVSDAYRRLENDRDARELYQYVLDNWPEAEFALWSRMGLAVSSMRLGDYDAAGAATIKLLSDFSQDKRTPTAALTIADEYRRMRRRDDASELYHYLVNEWPQDGSAMWAQKNLVELDLESGGVTAAQAGVDKLLTEFSTQENIAQAAREIASHSRRLRKFEMADKLCQLVVERWPGTENALWALGDLAVFNIATGDEPAAQQAVDKLRADFAKDKRVSIAVCGIADRYRRRGKHEKACELYQYVLDNWPDAEHALWAQMGLAITNVWQSNDEAAQQATEKLRTAFSEDERSAVALCLLADEYRKMERHDKARELYQHVVTNWPNAEHAVWSQTGLAVSAISCGDDIAARAAIEKLVAQFSGCKKIDQAVQDIVRQYRQLQQYDKAEQVQQYVTSVLNNQSESDRALWSQAAALVSNIALGNDANTEAAIDKFIGDFNDHPDFTEAVFRIAEQCYNMKNYLRAIEFWEFILTEYPQCYLKSEIPHHLATCFEHLKNYPAAIKYYTQVVEQYPDSPHAYHVPYCLGILYRRLKQYDQAIYWFQQQRQLYSREPLGDRSLYCEGLIYLYKLSDYQKAAEIFQTYLEAYPNGERATGLYSLAVCCEKMGDKIRAIELLQQGLNKHSDTIYAQTYSDKLKELQ